MNEMNLVVIQLYCGLVAISVLVFSLPVFAAKWVWQFCKFDKALKKLNPVQITHYFDERLFTNHEHHAF